MLQCLLIIKGRYRKCGLSGGGVSRITGTCSLSVFRTCRTGSHILPKMRIRSPPKTRGDAKSDSFIGLSNIRLGEGRRTRPVQLGCVLHRPLIEGRITRLKCLLVRNILQGRIMDENTPAHCAVSRIYQCSICIDASRSDVSDPAGSTFFRATRAARSTGS